MSLLNQIRLNLLELAKLELVSLNRLLHLLFNVLQQQLALCVWGTLS